MPMHDWTRVDAGIFHSFHLFWLASLSSSLNNGLLPSSYYALAEQHAGPIGPDVLTLQVSEPRNLPPQGNGTLAVAEAPPRVHRKMVAAPIRKGKPRTLMIRHVSDHRIVAMVEVISPANKDRRRSVEQFVAKARSALYLGIHLLVLDCLPPTRHDPQGIPGKIWKALSEERYRLSAEGKLSLAAFVSRTGFEAYVEFLSVGDLLPPMPLFLTPEHYVNIPLEATYQAAYRGVPEYWRNVLEGSPAR